MKRLDLHFKHLVIYFTLVLTSLFPVSLKAQADVSLDQQKDNCNKSTAHEWSASLNRCIQKKQTQTERHEALECNKIEDLKERAECHKQLAEKKTGLNSDPSSLNKGQLNKSTFMNGITLSYTILGLINSDGKELKGSSCMSKTIFGVTAFAGFATDLFLKMRTKKKINALKDKYKLEVSQGAYDAQVKALQYLKEEQQTVVDIAAMEKKRNMLLMMGYGAATAMAIYEMLPIGKNPACYAQEPGADANAKPENGSTTEVGVKPDPAPTPASNSNPPHSKGTLIDPNGNVGHFNMKLNLISQRVRLET